MTETTLLNLPEKRRPRRTQTERRAETRRRILTATVESIGEIGYQRTTSAEIARRSGVTWGAVQHHFGSKAGILGAILEDSFNRFSESLASSFADLEEDASIDDRIDRFVDAAWAHFESPHYRATFEILLEDSAARDEDSAARDEDSAAPDENSAARGDVAAAQDEGSTGASQDRSWQAEILKAWTTVWQRLFPDVELDGRRTVMIQHYTIATLSGLASMKMLAGGAAPFVSDELDILKRTLALEFEAASTPIG